MRLASFCILQSIAVLLLYATPLHAQSSPAAPDTVVVSEPTPPVRHAGTTPQLDLHGFFDITLKAGTGRTAGHDSSTFEALLGQFDLYILSRLTDRSSFLGELVIEGDGAEAARIELERAHLRYWFSDQLQLTVGRTHSPISFWNVIYHHGALLEPTAERPGPVQFEDAGGLLPLHAIGLEFGGELPAGAMRLKYVASLSNGRAPDPGTIQTSADRNRDKALGALLAVQFDEPFSLTLGAALHHDRIPASVSRTAELDQDIVGAHAVARTGRYEAIGEYFVIRDRDRTTRAAFQQRAWYGVISTGGGRWHPYAAAEHTVIDTADPYYSGSLTTRQRASFGVRFDISEANVLKLEYRDNLQSGSRSHELALQTAFTF